MDYLYLDLEEEYNMAWDAPALVERMNLILTGGLFSKATKNSIIQSVEQLSDPVERVRAALFLSFISPEYAVGK